MDKKEKNEELSLITDDVIEHLKPLLLRTVSDADIKEYLYMQCQKVLELAKEKNCSKEVAIAINLDTYEVSEPVFGDLKSVDIGYLVKQMKGTECAFLVAHNHPSNASFSWRDIKTYIDSENITIILGLPNDLFSSSILLFTILSISTLLYPSGSNILLSNITYPWVVCFMTTMK